MGSARLQGRVRAARPVWLLLLPALLSQAGMPASASSPGNNSSRQIRASRLPCPPVIDGDLSDPAWPSAAEANGFTDEYDESPPPDETRVWIGYDARAIYVAFHCKQKDPDAIVARQTRREGSLRQDDHVAFVLNTFGTRRGEDESVFAVNALGTQETDIAGGRAGKQEWLGRWRAATRRVPDGWAVEMEIPWEIVPLPAGGEPVEMDVNFRRRHAREQRRSVWSNLGASFRRELGGRWVGVELPAIARRRLSVLGCQFGGISGPAGGVLHSGLDARWEVTPRLSVVGTLNPDFANIEGDIENIDFSYSEKLTSERRPFFLEGGDYLRFGGDGESGTLFASQRIPQFDTGFKVFGKPRPTSHFGLLGALSGRRSDTVFRWRETLGVDSSVTLGYVRRDETGARNEVAQLQTRGRHGNWNWNASLAGSRDTTGPGERWSLGTGWNWGRGGLGLNVLRTSPGFLARNGYVPFRDVRHLGAYLYHEARWKSGPVREAEIFMNASEASRYSGAFFQRLRGVGGRMRLAGDLNLRLQYREEGFEEHRDRLWSLGFLYPASDPLHSFGVQWSFGRRRGSPYRFLAPGFTYRFGHRLTMGLSMETLHHAETREQDIFTVNYDLDRARSVGGRLVQRDGRTNWRLSFRQGGYGGVEFFLIVGDPNADEFTGRVVMKAVAPLW